MMRLSLLQWLSMRSNEDSLVGGGILTIEVDGFQQ